MTPYSIPLKWLICLLCLLLSPQLLAHGGHSHAGPSVVVTIKPVHSLVSGLLKNVDDPVLLLNGHASPHTYQLKPSDAQLLQSAKLVIWVGPTLEGFLKKPIAASSNDSQWLKLTDSIQDHQTGKHAHQVNPHFWLDPQLTSRTIAPLTQALIKIYPEQSQMIKANAKQLTARLHHIDQQVQQLFKHKRLSALAYHDAWQHLLRRYGLYVAGVISTHEQHTPGPAHLHTLQKTIKQQQVACLLLEPQYAPRYINALDPDKQLLHVTVDPLGSSLTTGSQTYFKILQQVSQQLSRCLRPSVH